MNDTPTHWALVRARELTKAELHKHTVVDYSAASVDAFVRYIEEHEAPPADPDEEALNRILAASERITYSVRDWELMLAQYKKEIGK